MTLNIRDGIKVTDRIDHFPMEAGADEFDALYASDLGELILETCSIEDVENTFLLEYEPEQELMLEAITAKYSKLKNRMVAFTRGLRQSFKQSGLGVGELEIGKPRKSGAVAVVTTRIAISDGQSISVVFHAPDNDPMKVNPTDTLIAFRFMLNSRDITHIVAPSGGKDISIKQAAMALANVAERNSEKFQQAQTDKAALQAELEDYESRSEELESQLAVTSDELETVGTQLSDVADRNGKLQSRIDTQNKIQEELKEQITGLEGRAIKASNVVQGNFVDNDIREKVRSMTLAEFQSWARSEKGMSGKLAEDLYNDTIKQLEASYNAKNAAKPENKANVQLGAALKEKLGSLVEMQNSSGHTWVTIDTGVKKLSIAPPFFHTERNTMSYQVDLPDDYRAQGVWGEIQSTQEGELNEESLSLEVSKIVEFVRKNQSTRVDLSERPAYGSKAGEDGSAKEISARTRKAISAAIKSGELPKGLKVSIKTGGSNMHDSINVTIKALPEDINLYSEEYIKTLAEDSQPTVSFSADALAIKKWIDAEILQYHWDKSDSMTDYFHNRFYYTGGADFGYDLERERRASEVEAYKESLKAEQADNVTKYWYGLQARPYGMGTTPGDAVEVEVISAKEASQKFPDANRKVRHGAIAYAKPLTEKQIYDFELQDLNQKGTDENVKDIGDYLEIDGDIYSIESIDANDRTIVAKDDKGISIGMSADELTELGFVVDGVNDAVTLKDIKTAEEAKVDELASSKAKARARAEAITKEQVDYVKSISDFRKSKEEYTLMGDPDGDGDFYLSGIKIADEYADHKFYTDDERGFNSLITAKKWAYKLAALGLINQGYEVPPESNSNAGVLVGNENSEVQAVIENHSRLTQGRDKRRAALDLSEYSESQRLIIQEHDRLNDVADEASLQLNILVAPHKMPDGRISEEFRNNPEYKAAQQAYAKADSAAKAWLKANKKLLLGVSQKRSAAYRAPKVEPQEAVPPKDDAKNNGALNLLKLTLQEVQDGDINLNSAKLRLDDMPPIPEQFQSYIENANLAKRKATFSLELIQVIKELEAYEPEPEEKEEFDAVQALTDFIGKGRAPKGWKLEKAFEEDSISTINLDPPLPPMGDDGAYGYMLWARDSGDFDLTYSEGTPVEGGSDLGNWQEVLDRVKHDFYEKVLPDIEIDDLFYDNDEEDIEMLNELRQGQGLEPLTLATTEESEQEGAEAVQESEEQPEQPVETKEPEPTEEEKYVEALRAIRDYSGESTLEKAKEFQETLEAAVVQFEQAGTMAEHEPLLEEAFATLVKVQGEIKV